MKESHQSPTQGSGFGETLPHRGNVKSQNITNKYNKIGQRVLSQVKISQWNNELENISFNSMCYCTSYHRNFFDKFPKYSFSCSFGSSRSQCRTGIPNQLGIPNSNGLLSVGHPHCPSRSSPSDGVYL